MERKEHMADEILMEEMENEAPLITLEDEEGNEMEFEFLDIVEYEGEEYIVLIENNEDADEDERAFYRFDKIRNLDGEAVEADILGNGSREEGCK